MQNNGKSRARLLLGKVKFSKIQLSVFAMLFGLLGGYAIYKSFAAIPVVATVEAESMISGITSTPPPPSNVTAPGPPQNTVQSAASTTSISLSWTAPKSGGVVSGYKLYKNDVLAGTTTSMTYTYSGLSCGTTYKVGITAYNAGGESDIALDTGNMSTSACSTTPTPSPTPSPSSSASLEGEKMTFSPKLAHTFTDTLASGGSALMLSHSTSAIGSIKNTVAATNISITAKSTACNNTYSYMTIKVDNTQVLGRYVRSSAWKTYTKSINLSPGTHTVAVAFTNDAYTPNVCDRNLSIDKVVFGSAVALAGSGQSATLAATTSGFAEVISDSNASNGQAVDIFSNGTLTSTFTTSQKVNSLSVTARSDVCEGMGATMVVSVDGKQLLSSSVSSTSWQTYNVNSTIASGSHTLSISFTNDTVVANVCDRNLYVDKSTFFGEVALPTAAPAVSINASPSTISTGQASTLTWSSTNASSCNASGGWSGTKSTSGSLSTGALNQSTIYTLTCNGAGGTGSATSTVTVNAAAPPPSPTPPPSSGNVIQLSGTVSSSQVNQAAASVSGTAIVRGPFTVNGTLTISRSNLIVDKATVNGAVEFASVSGSGFTNGFAQAVTMSGASNILIENNTFDNGGRVPNPQSFITYSKGLVFRGNTFKNFWGQAAETHSEALYFGASSTGLIENNTFTNNGNTGHLFFTWFPGDPNSEYPRDVCVRGNTFNATWGAYFAIQFRSEIPSNANIRISPTNVLTTNKANNGLGLSLTTSPQFNSSC